MKVLVLGAGLVGVTIAKDLANECAVTICDKNGSSLTRIKDDRIMRLDKDFFQLEQDFIKLFDIVVGALPGHLGYEAAKTVISAGKDYVDISFAPEDLSDLWETRSQIEEDKQAIEKTLHEIRDRVKEKEELEKIKQTVTGEIC